jgi:serine O-acetyltransferase
LVNLNTRIENNYYECILEMINNRKKLTSYLEADRLALGSHAYSTKWRYFVYKEGEIFYYQRLLRKLEYLTNKKRNIFEGILYRILYKRFRVLSLKYSFTIPLNVFGPGLSIAHRGFVVVNPKAIIGSNCRIHPGTVIGEKKGKSPSIGNNVYLGPGSKLFGDITIADNVKIGANAVVNKSILQNGATAVGIPAKIIN